MSLKEYMQISVSGDLVTVVDLGFYSSCLSGYMVDKNGNVYSNRRTGKYVKIGHRDRYGREQIIVNGRTFSIRDLIRRALPHFVSMTVGAQESSAGVFKKYVVGTVQNGGLSFSSNPKIHGSRDKAEEEAYRLANSLHGTRFAVCEVVSTVCVGEVDWEKA